MDEAGDDDSKLRALIGLAMRNLQVTDRGLMEPDQNLEAVMGALGIAADLVERLWWIIANPTTEPPPTFALRRLANALTGLKAGLTNDPILKPAERTTKPAPPQDIQHGRVSAAVVMEFL
jgi:hypothetical protein